MNAGFLPLPEWRIFGGAEGIRTLDLLDAIEARSQLRHGPTGRALILQQLHRAAEHKSHFQGSGCMESVQNADFDTRFAESN
jgi:hypothetical protein